MNLPVYSQVQYKFPAQPRQVRVESAHSCPAKCTFCHAYGDFDTGFPRMKPQIMKLDLVEHILKDIASWPQPLKEIVPTNFGEWPNNPEWLKIGQMMGELLPSTYIALPTTGIPFIKEGALEALASLPTLRWLNFSMNAYFQETWQRIL